MSELIRHKQDLIEHLTTKKVASKTPPESVFVTAVIRRNILTDEMQGAFISKGRVRRFVFEGVGGGVYKASIGDL